MVSVLNAIATWQKRKNEDIRRVHSRKTKMAKAHLKDALSPENEIHIRHNKTQSRWAVNDPLPSENVKNKKLTFSAKVGPYID